MYKKITLQKPISSPFTKKSSAHQVMQDIDLSGKTVIITGGYSGIGLVTVKALANAGAKVIVPARTLDKAKKAVSNLKNVEIGELDLMNPNSIKQFAETFLKTNQALDILIENAGIMFPPLKRDTRGNESQLSTNFLGHFQLTEKLYPALKKAENARVVILTSRAQSWNGVNFSDPNYNDREYNPKEAYAQSKSADILFAVELDKRAKKDGVRAYAVHPGLIPGTGLGRFSYTKSWQPKVAHFILNTLHGTSIINILNYTKSKLNQTSQYDYFKTINQGAASTLWASTSKLLNDEGGVFIEDCNIGETIDKDSKSKYGVRPWAIDLNLSKQIWNLGEQLTGTRFDIGEEKNVEEI